MVTLTRKETGSSWRIESAALELTLTQLEDKGLIISEVIHDDCAQVPVFSVQQLKDYCHQHSLQQSRSKLQLVQRVSVHLNLPEAGGTTEIQKTRPLRYPELASHDIAYKLKSWIYTCAKNAAKRGDTTLQLLTLDIHKAADHSTCRTLQGTRKYVVENWTGNQERKYPQGGEKHKALKDFMKKYWKVQLASQVFT
ncbi:hypothetical protein R1sor_024288 [Riccia sorocarpa]|uniref:Uncharacterized protein n=1 Tax=Riccia sorocarpa TaxID=122646 RepID=A0ABD3GQ40_9MARC